MYNMYTFLHACISGLVSLSDNDYGPRLDAISGAKWSGRVETRLLLYTEIPVAAFAENPQVLGPAAKSPWEMDAE